MSNRRVNHSHTCKAVGCTRQVPNCYLMCRKHWYAVPQHIRDRVWQTWAVVQTNGQMTVEYAQAVRDAINSVGSTLCNSLKAQAVQAFEE